MKKAALILLILLLVAAAGTALYARQNPQTPVTLTDLDAAPTPEAVG